MYVLTYSLSSRHVAGAGVAFSPIVETREILLPSLVTVHGHCGGAPPTRDHHCVSVGVRDGAGQAVINNVANLIIIKSRHFTLTLYNMEVGSLAPGSHQV